jgi:hypothetical protein
MQTKRNNVSFSLLSFMESVLPIFLVFCIIFLLFFLFILCHVSPLSLIFPFVILSALFSYVYLRNKSVGVNWSRDKN